MKKFRRIILNSIRGKSIVQKFNSDDLHKPVEEVVYAMPPVQALTYYFMQFIMGDFAWEKYPRYIKGTIRSSKIKDVYYYDRVEGYLIRSSPYCGGEKWRFHKKPKKAVLPERKKHLVLKEVKKDNERSDSKPVIGSRILIFAGDRKQSIQSRRLEENKRQVSLIRGGMSEVREIRQPLKVVAECSRKPRLKRR